MTRSLAEYIAHFFGVIHMEEDARVVRALEGHFGQSIPDEDQRMTRIEMCLGHLVALRGQFGSWSAVRDVLDEISPLPQSVESPPAPVVDAELVAKLARSVDELELTVRVANCFANCNVRHILDIMQMGEHGLLRTKNFGRASLKMVKGILNIMGLSLGMTLDEATIAAVREEIARRAAGR